MAPKVLVVLTSQDVIPQTGNPTGWYLPEFAHPWHVLHDKTDLTIASPKGGEAPLDPNSVQQSEKDEPSITFLNNQQSLWKKTVKLSEIVPKAKEFDAIFYVGGHGPMFDLSSDPTSLALIQTFASAKKPVAAVCHGPAAFVNATNSAGEALIKGAQVTGFSNDEEIAMDMMQYMPFELETELNKKSEGGYVKADEQWAEKVVTSKTNGLGGPLITGQNPASATAVGKEILKVLGV